MDTATKIEEAIESVAKAPFSQEVRVTRRIEVGQAIMQGDVILHRVPNDWPRGKELGTRQVAVGEGVGSRHVAVGEVTVFEGAKLPEGVSAPFDGAERMMLGPVVVANPGTEEQSFTLEHPNHPWHTLPCKDHTYQVTYPVDGHTQKRVQD